MENVDYKAIANSPLMWLACGLCVALVICGIWLVRGPKGKKNRKKPEPPQDEDFTEYTAADPAVPDEDAGFAMPKLAALLGKPVTPEQPEQPEKPEDDDGRAE